MKNAFALRKEALEKELPDEEECMKAMMGRLMNELSFYGSGSDANGFDADLRKEILQFSRELFEKYAGKLKNRPEPHVLHQEIDALSVFEAPRWSFLAKDNSPEAKAEYQDALKRLEKICLIIMDDPKYFAACRTTDAKSPRLFNQRNGIKNSAGSVRVTWPAMATAAGAGVMHRYG